MAGEPPAAAEDVLSSPDGNRRRLSGVQAGMRHARRSHAGLPLIMLVLLTACATRTPAPGSSTSGLDSGITGTAVAGPQCPVERPGSPCPPRPVSADITVRDGSGVQVTIFTTAVDGTFRVPLPPGTYTLLTTGVALPLLQPQQVSVESGRFTEVMLELDTGIR
jgi:hypothetical protein